ncbi:MAG: universal stress protein [Pseudomonadales bacterium]|nr:universal stress protein [Pseudomonadales bacterium]MDP6471490.1 universal stress protein [Pseudomonadales bacterium]MDP6828660.1 universal stress protein [Pseudomonadales bacterium]MDP6972378.1 universal stress protein [Pseudomonadales bacterium]
MKVHSIVTIMDKPTRKQTALKRALAMQKVTGAALELVSFCWESMDELRELTDARERRAVKRGIIAERKAWQREMLASTGGSGTDITYRTVWTNNIAEWTLRRIEESQHDLIIKSVEYSKSLLPTLLDWQLLREANVPLLLTSTRRRRPSGNVLAAIDLRSKDRLHDKLNRVVLDAAHSYAAATGTKMHCVYVIEVSQILKDLDAIDPDAIRKKAIEKSRARLDELLSPYAVPKTRIHLPTGRVGHGVAGTAHKIKADLLVVGTAAHHARQLVGLGNSAERVLARAPCDVLAVHPQ